MFIVFHVLHSALYLFLFSENEISIDGKKHELKKEKRNNIGATNAKRERRTGLVILLEPISGISHTYKGL